MTVKRLLGAALALLIVAAGLMLFGLEPLFALAAGILAAAVVMLLALRDERTDVGGRPEPDPGPYARGSEVSRLAWGINPRTDVAGETVARRARAVLRRRLARRGIDVDNPDHAHLVDGALGEGVWAALNARRATRTDINRALDATE